MTATKHAKRKGLAEELAEQRRAQKDADEALWDNYVRDRAYGRHVPLDEAGNVASRLGLTLENFDAKVLEYNERIEVAPAYQGIGEAESQLAAFDAKLEAEERRHAEAVEQLKSARQVPEIALKDGKRAGRVLWSTRPRAIDSAIVKLHRKMSPLKMVVERNWPGFSMSDQERDLIDRPRYRDGIRSVVEERFVPLQGVDMGAAQRAIESCARRAQEFVEQQEQARLEIAKIERAIDRVKALAFQLDVTEEDIAAALADDVAETANSELVTVTNQSTEG